jgi:hypothetical protein
MIVRRLRVVRPLQLGMGVVVGRFVMGMRALGRLVLWDRCAGPVAMRVRVTVLVLVAMLVCVRVAVDQVPMAVRVVVLVFMRVGMMVDVLVIVHSAMALGLVPRLLVVRMFVGEALAVRHIWLLAGWIAERSRL